MKRLNIVDRLSSHYERQNIRRKKRIRVRKTTRFTAFLIIAAFILSLAPVALANGIANVEVVAAEPVETATDSAPAAAAPGDESPTPEVQPLTEPAPSIVEVGAPAADTQNAQTEPAQTTQPATAVPAVPAEAQPALDGTNAQGAAAQGGAGVFDAANPAGTSGEQQVADTAGASYGAAAEPEAGEAEAEEPKAEEIKTEEVKPEEANTEETEPEEPETEETKSEEAKTEETKTETAEDQNGAVSSDGSDAIKAQPDTGDGSNGGKTEEAPKTQEPSEAGKAFTSGAANLKTEDILNEDGAIKEGAGQDAIGALKAESDKLYELYNALDESEKNTDAVKEIKAKLDAVNKALFVDAASKLDAEKLSAAALKEQCDELTLRYNNLTKEQLEGTNGLDELKAKLDSAISALPLKVFDEAADNADKNSDIDGMRTSLTEWDTYYSKLSDPDKDSKKITSIKEKYEAIRNRIALTDALATIPEDADAATLKAKCEELDKLYAKLSDEQKAAYSDKISDIKKIAAEKAASEEFEASLEKLSELTDKNAGNAEMLAAINDAKALYDKLSGADKAAMAEMLDMLNMQASLYAVDTTKLDEYDKAKEEYEVLLLEIATGTATDDKKIEIIDNLISKYAELKNYYNTLDSSDKTSEDGAAIKKIIDSFNVGYCGSSNNKDAWWIFEDGTVSISGKGNINTNLYYQTDWKSIKSKITKVEVNEGVTDIPAYTFQGASKLKNVTLPSTLKAIKQQAFQNTAIEEIVIPEGASFGSVGDQEKDKEIFSGCTNLKKVTLPSNTTTIPFQMFDRCEKLTDVNFSDLTNLEVIGNKAFITSGISGLVDLSNTKVRNVGWQAFVRCNIEKIILPEVKTLYLANLPFPDTVKEIVINAKEVTTDWAQSLFADYNHQNEVKNPDTKILVPKELEATFKDTYKGVFTGDKINNITSDPSALHWPTDAWKNDGSSDKHWHVCSLKSCGGVEIASSYADHDSWQDTLPTGITVAPNAGNVNGTNLEYCGGCGFARPTPGGGTTTTPDPSPAPSGGGGTNPSPGPSSSTSPAPRPSVSPTAAPNPTPTPAPGGGSSGITPDPSPSPAPSAGTTPAPTPAPTPGGSGSTTTPDPSPAPGGGDGGTTTTPDPEPYPGSTDNGDTPAQPDNQPRNPAPGGRTPAPDTAPGNTPGTAPAPAVDPAPLNNPAPGATDRNSDQPAAAGLVDPGNPGNGPTPRGNQPVINKNAAPVPDAGFDYPTYRNEMPDPNDPNSPPVIVVIDEEDIPLAYRKTKVDEGYMYIEDPSIPLARATGQWALVNLILTIATVMLGIVPLLRKYKNKREEEAEAREQARYGQIYATESNERQKREEEEEKKRKKRSLAWKLIGAAVGIASLIVFILTEDMRLPMQYVDKWTLLMAVLAVLQVPGLVAKYREAKEEKPDDDLDLDFD